MKSVYLDNAANTMIDNRVLSAMKPYLKNFVGNSSASHDFGVKASQAILKSRTSIAQILGYKYNEIFFTSSATEANNTIIKSLALHEIFQNKAHKRMHIVVSAIEHSSIIQTCKEIEKWGFEITYVQPDQKGVIRPSYIKKVLRKDTLLVCVMGINNEIGSYNNIDAIGKLAQQNFSYMMADCTQLIGTYLGNNRTLFGIKYKSVDFVTFSAHKLYGPIGVGVMIIRSYDILDPLLNGGSQEFGMRGGTSNTAGIVGTAKSIELINSESSYQHYNDLYNYLIQQLDKYNIKYRINGIPVGKNIISLTMFELISDKLADDYACHNIAVSAGSACDNTHDETKGDFNPSHVLKSLDMCDPQIKKTIRISFSKYTTKKDINAFIKATLEIKKEMETINENLSNYDN